MAYDPDLLDMLEELPPADWEGEVYRYTAGRRPPDRENTSGARWNPPEVPAIYTALEPGTLAAELRHALGSWSPPPDPKRFTVYTITVALHAIVDLRGRGQLERLGVDDTALAGDDHGRCQTVAGAAHYLGIGGLLVPSARLPGGSNLVIFTTHQSPAFGFDVVEQRPANELFEL